MNDWFIKGDSFQSLTANPPLISIVRYLTLIILLLALSQVHINTVIVNKSITLIATNRITYDSLSLSLWVIYLPKSC